MNHQYTLLLSKKWLGQTLHFLARDIARIYDRTLFGVLWHLVTQAVTIGGIGFVFSMVFKTNLKEFFPHLAISILSWNLISGIISESPRAYLAAGPILNAFKVPYATFILRLVLRYFVMFMFGLPIYLIVAIYFDQHFSWAVLLIVPNFILFFILIYPVANIFGFVGARFRDFSPIVGSIVYLFFLISPVLYKPSSIMEQAPHLLFLNPFYYLLELVRSPFLGYAPSISIYFAVAFATIIAWLVSAYVNKRFGRYLVFWVQ